MVCFWTLLLVVLAGLYKFKYWLDSLGSFFKATLVPFEVPLVGQELTLSTLLCWVLLPVISAVVFFRLFNRPKVADFLIETEAELKKCTWPTMTETWNASLIVVVTVVIVGVFLAGADVVLKKLFDIFIFSGSR